MARERRLGARQVEEIFLAFAEAMRELPPDIEAGWLDAQGDLRLAPDIARKLRTARRVRQLLQELRQRDSEGDGSASGGAALTPVRAGDDPSSCSRPISAADRPSTSARTTSVCSPRRGAGRGGSAWRSRKIERQARHQIRPDPGLIDLGKERVRRRAARVVPHQLTKILELAPTAPRSRRRLAGSRRGCGPRTIGRAARRSCRAPRSARLRCRDRPPSSFRSSPAARSARSPDPTPAIAAGSAR